MGKNVNKMDLILAVARKMEVSEPKARVAVNAVLDSMTDVFVSAEKDKGLHIRGFGNFTVRQTKKRPGRNPKTGAAAEIPSRRILKFRCHAGMRGLLNN